MITRTQAADAVVMTKDAIAKINASALGTEERFQALLAVRKIGNMLTKELVCGCATIDELLDKWALHGYRPTLRGHSNSIEHALADCYDACARLYGFKMQGRNGSVPLTAYRGSK